MPEAGKLRLVLDYVPCDACLAIPAASPAEQELLCGICRRLDRRVGHKITVRRAVPVATPEVPLEVVVPPAAAPEPVPEPPAALPSVEVVLADGAELPPPTADLQIVLAPVEAPAAPVAPAEEEAEVDDLFGYTPETREELFDFVPPAHEAPPPSPSESYVIEPQSVAPEEWPAPLEEVAPPPPAEWPAEPAEETPLEPAPWPAEPEPEPAAQPAPWPDAEPQPAHEEPPEVEEVPEAVEEVPETAEEIPQAVEEVPETAEEIPQAVEEVPETAEEIPEAVEEVPETAEEIPEEVEEVSEAVEEAPAPAAAPAGGEGDLPVSALEGLGARYQRRLGEEGVTNLRELAGRDPAELADLTGIPERFLAKWVEEAKRRSG